MRVKTEMSQAIYLPKWVELLIALYNTEKKYRYCGCLHRKTGITIRHIRNLVSDLEAIDFVVTYTHKNNKIKLIDLTDRGKEIAVSFLKIYPFLKR